MTPATPERASRSLGGGAAALALLLLAALASLGYAGWAFTGRRSIFADFSDERSVSLDDARSNDRINAIFLAVAGLLAAAALVVWLVRWLGGSRRGVLDLSGLGLAALGIVTVVTGLILASRVSGAAGQVLQGDKGVTATTVLGTGFVLLAASLVVGLFAARAAAAPNSGASAEQGGPDDYGWTPRQF